MNELLLIKTGCGYEDEEYLCPSDNALKNKYGFIHFDNPNYLVGNDDRKYLIRKATPKERREIIINAIIEGKGRPFRIPKLAKILCVSDRTVQTTLRSLEREKLIEIIPRHNKNGMQKSNAYRYIGPPCEKYGSGLTLKLLYSLKQDVGFRDWCWENYEFYHDKCWHNPFDLCETKFGRRAARKKYLLDNNLSLIVPEDIKYVVLRYCFWRGKKEKLDSDDYLYSKDGTIKLELFPLNRIIAMPFFEDMLAVEFSGTEDNPRVTVYDAYTDEVLGSHTWFDSGVITSAVEIDEDNVEEFYIIVDFTTK